jgi:hypothetical protein
LATVGTPVQAELYRLHVVKVRKAIDEIETLMLTDTWDSIPPERQRALVDVVQQLRADVAPIERPSNRSRSRSRTRRLTSAGRSVRTPLDRMVALRSVCYDA